ncbi:7501_t:CDS:10, partial [Paraglomus occultum]
MTKGFGVIKFYKHLNYRHSQRQEAEEHLRKALEAIASEQNAFSGKAQDWLRDLSILTHNFSSEQYWNSVRVSEERETTKTTKAISAEKEEQHVVHIMSNVIIEHDTASSSLRNVVQERLEKRRVSFETLSNPKKKKSDFTVDISFDEYIDAVSAIETVRVDNAAAHTDPSWWGFLDFREEGVHPNLSLPRAKQFLSEEEINRLMAMARRSIEVAEDKMGRSAKSFLDALSRSDVVSLRVLAKERGTRGLAGLCALLEKESEANEGTFGNNLNREQVRDYLAYVNIEDDDTMYIGKCFEDVNAWISSFNGQCQSERTIDMFVLGPCAKTPRTVFLYGDNHSDADREDKTERSGTDRVGKSCDYLYWSSRREIGVGENAGPKLKDHHDAAKSKFIDVMKVAKSQHIQFKTLLIEQTMQNPLPKSVQETGDLYGIYEWASEDLPIKDTDVGEVILLCKRFLIHRYLIDNAGRTLDILSKKTKLFRDEMAREDSPSTVQLEHLRTPLKK